MDRWIDKHTEGITHGDRRNESVLHRESWKSVASKSQ
jgi:hypothetical protein